MTEAVEMPEARPLSQIYPGRGLGWMNLGASLHGVLSRLKSQPQLYPQLGLTYSSEEPISAPVVLNLPFNGIRLRFDGPDQRLRLIEINDFSKTTFTYKNIEVVRRPGTAERSTLSTPTILGPSFRHIYNRLFGPAYAGEYIPPSNGDPNGIYILSYPGLSVRFSLKHRSFAEKADFVSLLTAAASPAMSIAIFSGPSWPEARDELFTKPPPLPRSIALAGKNVETVPDEIENIVIRSGGKLELIRRSMQPFTITLSKTTVQDLVAELGPPDAIFRKTSSRLSIHATTQPNVGQKDETSPVLHPSSVDSARSLSTRSFNSGIDDDSESETLAAGGVNVVDSDTFYNYFQHGFDIMVSHSKPKLRPFTSVDPPVLRPPSTHSLLNYCEATMVVSKVFIHGNIPGSYSFNRHRRGRWEILLAQPVLIESSNLGSQPSPLPPRQEALSNNVSVPPIIPKSKSKSRIKSHSQLHAPIEDTLLDATFDEPFRESPVARFSTATRSKNMLEISSLTSEHTFSVVSATLKQVYSEAASLSDDVNAKTYLDSSQRGMVLNRGWGGDESPESSIELLGGTMNLDSEDLDSGYTNNMAGNGPGGRSHPAGMADIGINSNTHLFGFPGMLFEVLKNDVISCLTIY